MESVVLRTQGMVDRWSRWMRLAPPLGETSRRRFLIVQIDGLSRTLLDRALAGGSLRGLLASGRLALRDLSVGLPSSTPAFQAAIMYGGRPDIPGFHFYDKRAGRELHFPARGVADLVERRHAEGRPGILEGGSCYGCVFTGGAADSLWTFARLKRLARAGRGVRRAALSALLLAWVALKCVGLTLVTLARVAGRAILALAAGRVNLRWLMEALLLDIGISIWVRELFTLLVSADLYRGVPAIYVNFIDYDVFAHAYGPADRLAFRALRRVDRSILQLARIVRRLPELGYDLYVLSDHGQVATRPFGALAGGASLEQVVRAAPRSSRWCGRRSKRRRPRSGSSRRGPTRSSTSPTARSRCARPRSRPATRARWRGSRAIRVSAWSSRAARRGPNAGTAATACRSPRGPTPRSAIPSRGVPTGRWWWRACGT